MFLRGSVKMYKRPCILFVLLIIIAGMVGCATPQDAGYFNVVNTPTVTGTVNAVVPSPLPVNIDGVTVNDGCVPSIPYYYQIADNMIAGHTSWSKLGFTPAMGAVSATTESDVWSAGGVYAFPTTAQQMQVVSTNNTDDIGTVIFDGDSSGGSTTTLVDVTKDFTFGTPVAINDVILLDTTKEYGFVTSVAATTLTCSGGFSSGGSGTGQAYRVIDTSATAGAQVVAVEYLDASYNTQWEYVVLNGTTVVNTVSISLYRINSFRVISAGANKKPTGNLVIRNTAGTTNYSYISAGYTRARNSAYTIPAGYTLYIAQLTYSFGYSANQTHYARIYGRATQNNNFRTDGIFYPFTEVICANSSATINLDFPSKFLEKVDIKVSGVATVTGSADIALRGWIETQ